MLNGQNVLVTRGTGSFGKCNVRNDAGRAGDCQAPRFRALVQFLWRALAANSPRSLVHSTPERGSKHLWTHGSGDCCDRPAHAVLVAVRMIDQMPRNENDKLDRKAVAIWFKWEEASK